MLHIENENNFNFDQNVLENICKKLTSKDVELVFTDDVEIKKLNKNYRNIDASTDVLSFPLKEIEHSPLGSIVINFNRAEKISKELQHTVDEEISLLFIHGLLHLLGYDHETDDGEMREKEKELIGKFHLPDSLIVRTKEIF